ncbi:DctP family TRAP transporter solute-binding subunit [Ureibacillus acetophenoni]|uniref:C4-dicarboxylate-binding protein DctP n=1 Tax=Ureibacillus acetophenoni TaxID=614649 RepID=A0A285UH47_9BACL|nr:DctP family TRAP transporter solute-binding subunit [Ureibacillus acetophenoni]SOC41235.1 C4-dicarboxylate-binding protein DctP [Ureibacillus acetophenoni]
MKRVVGLIILFFLFTIPFVLLVSFQSHDYPYDYEQLSEDERLVIRFSHVVGEDTPKGMAARKFAELVKERSNGYIEVQVFSNGTLYKDGEEMNALSRGDIQMIAPAISKLTNYVPEISVYDLPFAFHSLDEVHEFTDSEAGEILTDQLKEHNLYAIGLWDSGFKQLSNRIRPIQHYDDLKNLTMRIMPSDILAKQFTVLGAFPKEYDFNAVYYELQKKSVDGQENTLTNITSKNFYSLQDYLTISNHGYLGYFVLFNLDFWNSLDNDVKQLLTDTFLEVQQWEWEITKKLNDETLQKIENCQCIELHYLSDEDINSWEEKFNPVYDFYIRKYGDQFIKELPKFRSDT